MAASNELQLRNMVKTAVLINDRPCAFRYPRGQGIGADMTVKAKILDIGKGELIKEGNNLAILSFGARLNDCIIASNNLAKKGIKITIADAKFSKPILF